jgi:NitT/TauT family transport system substrate-binding protein
MSDRGFMFKIIFSSFVIALTMTGCSDKAKNVSDSNVAATATESDGTVALKEVSFLPYWVTNAQFAGYYVGKEMGFYKKHGIKLNIIPYQPFITSDDLIKDGKTDFAALWLASAIELKESGADIINIAQFSSRSSLMLVTKKKSGINSLQDMNGKKVGIWIGFELQPKVLFRKFQLDVKIIQIGSTNNLFLMDGVDITTANWFDEYNSIINSGYNPDELNTFFFADNGLNFLEDGIYCLSNKLKKDPKLCSDFVQATIEGWMYAFDNPEEAVEIVVNYAKEAKQPVNRTHQRWMINRYRDLYIPKGQTTINTALSEKDYQFVADVLDENGLITLVPSYDDFYQPVIKH